MADGRAQGDRPERLIQGPGSLQGIVERYLEQVNQSEPKMPDGSERRLIFRLAKRADFQLSINGSAHSLGSASIMSRGAVLIISVLWPCRDHRHGAEHKRSPPGLTLLP